MSRADGRLRRRLQAIDDYDFEHFVADLWKRQGWDTEVARGPGDRGVDVEARRSDGLTETKAVIQAKRYSEGNKVGRPKIQQYHSLKTQDPDADQAIVVTTSSFTQTAQRWADEHNMTLVDGADLGGLIEREGYHDLVEQYAPDTERVEPTEEPAESTDDTPASDSSTSTDGANEYYSAVAGSFVFQLLGLVPILAPNLRPTFIGNIGALLFMLAWLLAPLAVYFDAQKVHNAGLSPRPNRVMMPAISFCIPVVGVGYYAYIRAQAHGE
jgi:hypothetical protein